MNLMVICSLGEGIAGFLLFVLGVFIVYVVILWLSHITGIGVRTKVGGKVADPDDWSNYKKSLSDFGDVIKHSTLNKISKLSLYIRNPQVSVVEKLKTLNELKEKGAITSGEFNMLKDELLKNL